MLRMEGPSRHAECLSPADPELLDAMDRLGMLAMVENRNFVNTTAFVRDAVDMVLRDRNHPSVFMWSLCNEGGCYVWDEAMLETAALTGTIFKSAMLKVGIVSMAKEVFLQPGISRFHLGSCAAVVTRCPMRRPTLRALSPAPCAWMARPQRTIRGCAALST
jgi:hypothetical protein